MAKNTVYIAGPMRGYPRFNVDAFDGVAATWKQSGFSVRNPAEMDRAANVNHDAEVTSEDLRACMRRDLLAIIDECTAIALLPGWEKSAGVRVELALARFLGLPVYDAVTFERIEDGDKQPAPAPELELMQEFTAADTELCELAMELQNRGAVFEMTGSGAVLWWRPTGCCFNGKFCRYRMVSLPPGEPASEPTIEPGEEFGPEKFELAKRMQGEGVQFEYWNTKYSDWRSPLRGDPCSFNWPEDRYRRKPEPQEQTVEPVAAKPRKGNPDDRQRFSTGAVRSSDAAGTRYDLISHIGLRRIAETYAEGAQKYDDNNWLKGFPASDVINHCVSHIYKWLGGDTSEDHLAHAAWNLIAVMHFEEARPELIDCYHRNQQGGN